ncbi:hypothetical protein Tcan_00575, partial [Toxocara canis]
MSKQQLFHVSLDNCARKTWLHEEKCSSAVTAIHTVSRRVRHETVAACPISEWSSTEMPSTSINRTDNAQLRLAQTLPERLLSSLDTLVVRNESKKYGDSSSYVGNPTHVPLPSSLPTIFNEFCASPNAQILTRRCFMTHLERRE